MYIHKFVYSFLMLLLLRNEAAEGQGKLKGVGDDLLDDIRSFLRNVYIRNIDFDTGVQEFGSFKGNLESVNITGMDDFQILSFGISIKPLGVKNLTISIPIFNVVGNYNLDGTLYFPVGNKPLHVFGRGAARIVFGKASTSITLTLKKEKRQTKVKELIISLNIMTMDIKMDNLMGGGALQDIFNEYFSTIGPTVFDYYKKNITEYVKPTLITHINKFLDELFQ